MAATVVRVPQGGAVAARPRRENYFDAENRLGANSVLTLPFFNDARTMTDGGAAKVQGLHTNQLGQGGQVPRGHFLRVFGLQSYYTFGDNAITSNARLEAKRRVVDTAWFEFNLGSTPFLKNPLHRVPAGTGFCGPMATTENNVTIGDVQVGWPVATNYYDLTVPGKVKVAMPDGTIREQRMPRIPLEFAETESFTVDIKWNTSPTGLASGTTLILMLSMVSIYLKPLAG